MLGKFVINFWIWWYFVYFRDVAKGAWRTWLYWLGFFNLVPMVTNLFVPMYQDYSSIGRVVSFGIRMVWISVGSVFQIFLTIPVLIFLILMFVFPVLSLAMVVFSLI